MRVGGALAAGEIGPRINRAGAVDVDHQHEILDEIHAELFAKCAFEQYRP